MNINGTRKKLSISKNSIRELTQSEWDQVGGGWGIEITYSNNCATNGCPSDGCPVSFTCPSGTCNCAPPPAK
jgi:hypothetical protein